MKHFNGLTLIELLIALVLTVLLVTVGVPSFSSIYQHVRADTNIRYLKQSLFMARNHAISYGARVTMCPLIRGKCHQDWQNGFSIFIDYFPTNEMNENDTLIAQSPPFNPQDTVTYNRLAIRFQPEGVASGTNGTLKYCPAHTNSQYSRAIIVSQSGRIRYSKSKIISCD